MARNLETNDLTRDIQALWRLIRRLRMPGSSMHRKRIARELTAMATRLEVLTTDEMDKTDNVAETET